MKSIFVVLLLAPISAFAGYQYVDCQTANKSIVFRGAEKIKIKTVDRETNVADVYEAPLTLLPSFYADDAENTISAIPVDNKKVSSEERWVMKVTKKNGSVCYGREKWKTKFSQTFVLTAKNGEPLAYTALAGKKVEGMNEEGYISDVFQCADQGITTAGGCFVEEGDKEEWVKQ